MVLAGSNQAQAMHSPKEFLKSGGLGAGFPDMPIRSAPSVYGSADKVTCLQGINGARSFQAGASGPAPLAAQTSPLVPRQAVPKAHVVLASLIILKSNTKVLHPNLCLPGEGMVQAAHPVWGKVGSPLHLPHPRAPMSHEASGNLPASDSCAGSNRVSVQQGQLQ